MKRWTATLEIPGPDGQAEPAGTVIAYANDVQEARTAVALEAAYRFPWATGGHLSEPSRAPLTDRETLEEILKASDGATEGPWLFTPDSVLGEGLDMKYIPSRVYADVAVQGTDVIEGADIEISGNVSNEDGRFVARAREDSPAMARALLAVLDRADTMEATGNESLTQHAHTLRADVRTALQGLS